MIDIKKLTVADIGRKVEYRRDFCRDETGELTSWNEKVIFVRFKGPGGEACEPEDVSFTFGGHTLTDLDD